MRIKKHGECSTWMKFELEWKLHLLLTGHIMLLKNVLWRTCMIVFAYGVSMLGSNCNSVSFRTRVWTEPCLLQAAKQEYDGVIEEFLVVGEKLFGPYVWGRWNSPINNMVQYFSGQSTTLVLKSYRECRILFQHCTKTPDLTTANQHLD